LREVCDNIFEDLMKLVNSRNDAIHLENYENKWNALKTVVDRVFSDPQRQSVEAQNQALTKWFKEVIKSMEAVEIKRNEKFITNIPFYVDLSRMIPETVRSGLDTPG
jgi:hypothetical protein